jgi:hypothetical protein
MSVSPTTPTSSGANAAQLAALNAAKAQQASAKVDEDAAAGDPDHDGNGPEPVAQPTVAKGSPVAGAVLTLNAANGGGSGVSAAAATAAYQKAS